MKMTMTILMTMLMTIMMTLMSLMMRPLTARQNLESYTMCS